MEDLIKGFEAFIRERNKGGRGDTGPQGAQGVAGAQGPQGPKGDPGEKGERGDKGDHGERGVQGLKGDIGPIPEHRWDGSILYFQLPNGEWDSGVDLKGQAGKDAPPVNQQMIFSRGISAIKGLREELDALQEANMQYNKLIDTVGTVKYIGETIPGNAQSDPLWRIKKVDLTSEDIPITFAGGTAEFVNTWNDRLTYDYDVPA